METFAIWTTGIVLFLLIVPPVSWAAYEGWKRRKRRRLVDAPRKIVLIGDQTGPACVDHARSKSKAHRNKAGDLVSECRYCGVPMRRLVERQWEVISLDGGRADDADGPDALTF